MSIFSLILHASLPEQIILLILLVISISSWAMIIQRIIVIKRARRNMRAFEASFWSGVDLTKLYRSLKPELDVNAGIENVFCAGFREFSRLDTMSDPNVLIVSIQRVMSIAISREEDYLNKHLSFLASIGSIAPYIGLLGTVTGVMNAFIGIAQNPGAVTLASIAPGIAEALIATAMGLIAAIPAVWAYNSLSTKANVLLDNYDTFTNEFASILNRKIRQRTRM